MAGLSQGRPTRGRVSLCSSPSEASVLAQIPINFQEGPLQFLGGRSHWAKEERPAVGCHEGLPHTFSDGEKQTRGQQSRELPATAL